ncbi:MAG TPA: alpha/beta hydrolase [Nannocystis exedens]|nr:alpha/beta hydrolase [Nannocystis exedens]
MSKPADNPWSWPVRKWHCASGDLAFVDSGGDGCPLLLVHGLPTAKELWFPLIPWLLASDPTLRIIAVDLLGYGASEKPCPGVRHREQAAALDGLRRQLKIPRLTLVAHDLGASVAIDVLGAYAEGIERLVLVSPPVYPDFREPPVVKLLRIPGLGRGLLRIATPLLFDLAIGRGLSHPARLTPRLRRAMLRPYRDSNGRSALHQNLNWGRPAQVFAGYPAIMHNIAVPTLLIQGCDDPYIPIAQVARLHQHIAGSKLLLIADGAHFLPIDTPRAIATALLDFIDRE